MGRCGARRDHAVFDRSFYCSREIVQEAEEAVGVFVLLMRFLWLRDSSSVVDEEVVNIASA